MRIRSVGAAAALAALLAIGIAGLFLEPPTGAPQQYGSAENPDEEAHNIPRVEVANNANEKIATYTFWVAAFTFALAFVAFLQTVILFRTGKTARLTAENASKQLILVGLQTDILVKQKEIARLQYFAAHRPHISILWVETARDVNEEVTIGAHVTYVNTGVSNAKIIEIGSEFQLGPPPGYPRTYRNIVNPPNLIMKSGDESYFRVQSAITDQIANA